MTLELSPTEYMFGYDPEAYVIYDNNEFDYFSRELSSSHKNYNNDVNIMHNVLLAESIICPPHMDSGQGIYANTIGYRLSRERIGDDEGIQAEDAPEEDEEEEEYDSDEEDYSDEDYSDEEEDVYEDENNHYDYGSVIENNVPLENDYNEEDNEEEDEYYYENYNTDEEDEEDEEDGDYEDDEDD